MTTMTNLMRHTLRTDDGCWVWTGAVNNKGYGQVGDGGRTRSAHKVSYELHIGPVPDGLTIDHACHNADPTCPGGACIHRRCINPEHLDVVTDAENKRRRFRDRCPNNHAYTPENTAYRKDTGARNCRTCRRAAKAKQLKGYGRTGRPTNAERAAFAARQLADTG